MISVEKALQIVLESTPVLDPVTVPALGARSLVLAEDIVSQDDMPPFNMAMIDGFAVHSSDVVWASQTSPITLNLDGDIRAGCPSANCLEPGHAMKISGGAPVPNGADAIIPSEHAVRESAKKVKIYESDNRRECIFPKGGDIAAGAPVLSRGKVLTGADIGLLTAIGHKDVKCYRKPRVSFFASGNDLNPPDQPLQFGKIRAGNSAFVQCQLLEYGAEAIDLGVIQADSEQVKCSVEKALCSDMCVTSVGSSMEDFEFVKGTLQKFGLDLKFWAVAIRPGKPLLFGTIDGKPVFGLPGNWLSSLVILEEFVRPAISKLQGNKELRRTVVVAKLDQDVKGGGGITHYVRATVKIVEDGFLAVPAGSRNSPSVMALCSANGFIVIPPDVTFISAGEKVKVRIIPGLAGLL